MDPGRQETRRRDIRALFATLFLSRGTPMLTAGDEFGHTQKGNNNAYCQDNELSFIDWGTADRGLVDFVGKLSALRAASAILRQDAFFTGTSQAPGEPADVEWLSAGGKPMRNEDWAKADLFAMSAAQTRPDGPAERLCVVFNRSAEPAPFRLPDGGETGWTCILESASGSARKSDAKLAAEVMVEPRSVMGFAANSDRRRRRATRPSRRSASPSAPS